LPVVRPPTWFNHLDLDWSVQFRAAFYRFLTERAQLIRYDGRGSGLSDRYVPRFNFAGMEQDLETVVDGLALPRYALLGISQGGPVAIAHAVRHPQRVSKLLLIGAFSRGRNRRASTRDEEIGNAQLTLMRHGWGDEHSAFLKTFCMYFFPSAPTDELRAMADLQRMSMSAENAVHMRTLCDDIDIAAMLPRVSVPTLVVHSRHDNAVPLAEGEYLAAEIPNARLLVLESDNHLPLPQEPAWPVFTAAIEAFLRE
jgi:pimeloyl-ACP methyl ester carboxylesterase